MTKIINLTIETNENMVTIHLEMDKDKFNNSVLPLLTNFLAVASGPKKATE
jgi:hypothetical protein